MNQEQKINHIRQVMLRVLSECPFTFEDLVIEATERDKNSNNLITIKFYFESEGNASQVLGEKRKAVTPPICGYNIMDDL